MPWSDPRRTRTRRRDPAREDSGGHSASRKPYERKEVRLKQGAAPKVGGSTTTRGRGVALIDCSFVDQEQPTNSLCEETPDSLVVRYPRTNTLLYGRRTNAPDRRLEVWRALRAGTSSDRRKSNS